ncbi:MULTISPECIES: hypothetical protein [unclassified Sporosarcina]|uniref:hypothetical protein n=1 Tax=unclassified Sporosarcina TaxID=2647733 RepID=UPI00203F7552|nr:MULTISPECIES: hypothetical protein [unclassified Sporosarcina]GKV66708.1 hypothetical protein NCCP2331_28610 [Sporosarcina sp. NCCP-2331]GLB57109.1 hypothetical protein NCCP2378_28960 [Sporosarcina sp. NCCP-2378]
MNEQISCDTCSEDFAIKLKTKTHKITIKESYFVCPNCKTKYVAFVTDPECRKLQKEINQLRESKNNTAKEFAEGKINESEYIISINKIQNKIKNKMNLLEPKMNHLKQQYS